MLLNYLKLSLRLLVRNPFFTGINVLGLSVGFASFFILWQYASSGLKTDQYHKDYQRIGRIGCYWKWKEEVSVGQMKCGAIPLDQLPKIAEDFPQIVDHTRFIEGEFLTKGINSPGSLTFSVEQGNGERRTFKEARVISADSNLFNFFTIPMILGDKNQVLRNSNSIVLSQKTATKYFGDKNPINELLVLNDSVTLVVTGVFSNLPSTTHLNFDMVVSLMGLNQEWQARRWGQCFVKLNTAAGFEKLAEGINLRKEKYWGAEFQRWTTSDAEVFVQPLSEIAFSNYYWGDFFSPKSKFTLSMLVVVSMLVLVMAWINYMNLAISRTMKRLKEVATRKVTGARPKDLVNQFMVESFVIHVLAIGVALTIIQLVRQLLAIFFQIEIPEFYEAAPSTWLVFILVPLSGIILTALYPAFLSNSYNARSLFNFNSSRGFGKLLSSTLTTFQYTAAVALVLWVSVVYSQLDFILHMDLGIDKSRVVVLEAPATRTPAYRASFNSFMTQITRLHPATYGHSLIGDEVHWRVRMKRPRQAEFFQVDSNGGVDETFVPFFRIPLLAGRNFVPNDRDDVIIVSRYITERMGFLRVADAVGTMAHVDDGKASELEIVGVMEDYSLHPFVNYGESTGHYKNSREDGICLTFKSGNFSGMVPGKIAIRLDSENLQESMSEIEQLFQEIFPGSMFNWNLLEDHINKSYDQERVLSSQIALFTMLAIGISCLGLLGMISNKVEERTKEIGIRKVLGASLHQLGSVLLQTTFWQVIVAILLGLPIAYYLGQQYLEKYSERIELQWWHFLTPVALLLVIMFSVIASVVWKAARNNPVDALKYE